ncbi:MAG: winged helix-turn-helix domain-containing protein [Acidobacteria bacterium]|nr:winged helix-turn-helix domain-containing protein [Acidobacteriota bacterium]
MPFHPQSRSEWDVGGRVWHFAGCEFDESSRELRVNGAAVEVEAKPLEVLYQLLLHAGEVVTKEELLESAWPGVTVVEGSLATAISKLRKVLGEESGPTILTVPRIGYRIGVPVQCGPAEAPPARELGFQPGEAVPGRDQWKFVRRLDGSEASEVWLAEHPKTHEARVFKFAGDGVRLKALKREVTLARLLKDSLGERPEFVRVLEWNFDAPPFYLESEYCGPNLTEWAESQGGLKIIPLATRLRVFLELVRGVAAAHAVGVLHKDIKPPNVLMAPRPDGGYQVKVSDFGSGGLTEPARLSALGITNLGFTRTMPGEAEALTGTLLYLPPEVMAGQSPTAAADVYALGVMLYQLVAGDFRKPLAPGWEADVEDPLLREDIAEAACGDPARRLTSVAALAERQQTIEQRRIEREELQRARARTLAAEQRLEAARARRPWAVAAGVALAAGLSISLAMYGRAARERDRANRQTEIAAAVNRFLANDLLGQSDPFRSGKSEETLSDAVRRALPDIDRQFHDAPEVAARLHQAVARALDHRTEYDDARREYAAADALFLRAQGPLSQDAIAVELQRAAMEARAYQKGSLDVARRILAKQEGLIAKIARPRDDLPVWLASARGMIALIANDAKGAAAGFGAAYEAASKLAEFDENARLTLKQRLAFASIRMGDGARAERLFRELIDAFTRTSGVDSPSVLRVKLNLAQAYMVEGKNREAVDLANRIYPEYRARLGEDHELTMQLLTTRAQCEGSLELWAEAIRDDLAIHRIATHKQGAASFFAVATLSDAALAQCRSGRLAEGEVNARQAWETARKGFGERTGLTGGTAYTLASCDIGLGKLEEASRLLAGIDTEQVAQLASFKDWFANVELAEAEIAYRQGDRTGGRKHLEAARPVFTRPDAEAYQRHTLEALTASLER